MGLPIENPPLPAPPETWTFPGDLPSEASPYPDGPAQPWQARGGEVGEEPQREPRARLEGVVRGLGQASPSRWLPKAT